MEIATYLVKECGEDPNASDPVGFTPLMYAAHNGHKDCCEYLLFGAKADFWETNKDGENALQVAQKFGQSILAKYLMSTLLKLQPPTGDGREVAISLESGSVYERSAIAKRAMELVGCRVECYFRKKGTSMFGSKTWNKGTIVKYNEYQVNHEEKYHHGECRWEWLRFQEEPRKYRLLRRTTRRSISEAMASVVMEGGDSSAPMAVAVGANYANGREEMKAKSKSASAPINY